jgi:hypothetical protein
LPTYLSLSLSLSLCVCTLLMPSVSVAPSRRVPRDAAHRGRQAVSVRTPGHGRPDADRRPGRSEAAGGGLERHWYVNSWSVSLSICLFVSILLSLCLCLCLGVGASADMNMYALYLHVSLMIDCAQTMCRPMSPSQWRCFRTTGTTSGRSPRRTPSR